MSEQPSNRTTTDWLLDLCVYAPIGFVLDAHKYVPEFVERGRNQVSVAKVIGKFAVDRLEQQIGPLSALLGCGDGRGGAPASPPSSSAATPPEPDAPPVSAEGQVASAHTERDDTVPDDTVPDEEALAIAGYSTLSASQIVPRLTTLSAVDLDAIGRFERAHRGRRTILNRIGQLQSGR